MRNPLSSNTYEHRVANFYPGPGALPLSVLKRVREELCDFNNTGMSVMEISHRSAEIQFIIDDSVDRIKRLMNLGDRFEVIFLQGGGSLQFLMVPMNFSRPGDQVDYMETGYWAEKAIRSARSLNRNVKVVASSADCDHIQTPDLSQVDFTSQAKYLHICTNNTVVGTQFHHFPKLPIPLVADMSSDFMSKAIDTTPFNCIYAHAQKNIGLSGVTVVLIRKEMLDDIPDDIPEFLDYRTHVLRRSNYHTPPCFSIYVTWLILQWIEEEIGGLDRLEAINQKKASLLYEFIDDNPLFHCPIEKDSRSQMNVVFSLPTKELEERFIREAFEVGIVGVGGHRTRGGCRVSLYNGVPIEAVKTLLEFMKKFTQKQITI